VPQPNYQTDNEVKNPFKNQRNSEILESAGQRFMATQSFDGSRNKRYSVENQVP